MGPAQRAKRGSDGAMRIRPRFCDVRFPMLDRNETLKDLLASALNIGNGDVRDEKRGGS